MANSKISALTSATTALAGTETLPIVQSGATVKVAVSDLTAGRAVATGNLTTTGTATISSNAAIGTTSPNVNANRNTLTLQGAWGGEIDITVGATTHARFGTDNFSSGYSCRVESQDSIILKTGASSNVVVETGNVVIGTSGKGIDFSATPGTGTSELLADYEEGTWTPTVRYSTSDGDLAYSVQVGSYVKVGSVVTCVGYLLFSESTASGDLFIGGLPFTTKNTTNLRGGFGLFVDNLVLTVGGISGMFLENKTEFGVYYSGTGTETQISNTNTVAGSNVFRFSFSYIAA
jgi:hypothetical protein